MNPNEDMVRQMAELSELNAKHIAEIDKLKLEIAAHERAVIERTHACSFCDYMQKKHDELIKAVRLFVWLERELQIESYPKYRIEWEFAFAVLEGLAERE